MAWVQVRVVKPVRKLVPAKGPKPTTQRARVLRKVERANRKRGRR